jgi:very-short-patch-repair endonuclease
MARVVDTVVTRSPAMLGALHRTLGELAAPGRNGITTMRTLLAERPIGITVPASGNEARFEHLCEKAGLRGFERQVDVGGHSWLGRCDYRRADVKLIVEVDSRLHHTSVTDKANDAARDAARLAAGWRKVLRIWDDDLWHRPSDVIEDLRATLLELGAPEIQGFGAENGRMRTAWSPKAS